MNQSSLCIDLSPKQTPIQQTSLPNPDLRIEGILFKSIKNPLTWAATTLSTYLYKYIPSNDTSPYINCIGLAGFGYYAYKKRKQLWYEVSITSIALAERMKRLTGHTWYHSINDKISLGAIPLKNLGHLDAFAKNHIGAVLSLVEPHEATTSSLMSEPVLKHEWEAHKIQYLNLPTPDMEAPTLDKIASAVGFIFKNACAGRKTYIHCKAGIGRSATIAICYLLKHHQSEIENSCVNGDLVEKAIHYVKKIRPQIHLTKAQRNMVKVYIDLQK